jgi:hypothetical protein
MLEKTVVISAGLKIAGALRHNRFVAPSWFAMV